MERFGRGLSEGLRKRWGESVPKSVCRGYMERLGRGVLESRVSDPDPDSIGPVDLQPSSKLFF